MSLIFSYRCTSDKIAPYAILKHTTMYNASALNAGIPAPRVHQGKPSATTKRKNIKLKQKKQSESQKSLKKASAGEHKFLLSQIIRQPHDTPKKISPTSTTEQPNCLVSCNITLFHQKSKCINQIRYPAAAKSNAYVHTTSTASTKPMASTSKTVTPNKRRNITPRPTTTVQSKFIKNKPLTYKLNNDPPRGDHFRPKQQREKDRRQDNGSLHDMVPPNFITLSSASKLPKKLFESMSQTKNEAHFLSRKNTSNALLSRSHTQNTKTSEMKRQSAEVTKLPTIWNNTTFAYKTFKPTGKELIYVHVYMIVCSM